MKSLRNSFRFYKFGKNLSFLEKKWDLMWGLASFLFALYQVLFLQGGRSGEAQI
jgi:hypothetical protein